MTLAAIYLLGVLVAMIDHHGDAPPNRRSALWALGWPLVVVYAIIITLILDDQ